MEKPARYGGRPVRTKPLPTVNDSSDRAIGAGERLVLEVLRSGRVFRLVGGKVAALEREFAKLIGFSYHEAIRLVSEVPRYPTSTSRHRYSTRWGVTLTRRGPGAP